MGNRKERDTRRKILTAIELKANIDSITRHVEYHAARQRELVELLEEKQATLDALCAEPAQNLRTNCEENDES